MIAHQFLFGFASASLKSGGARLRWNGRIGRSLWEKQTTRCR